MKYTKKITELILCAIEQGYGTDLRPLFKNILVDLGVYLRLNQILREDE